VLDPFGGEVVQENPYGPSIGGEGEELGIAKVDPADIVRFAPPKLDGGVGALDMKEDSGDGLRVLEELAAVGALVKLAAVGAIVELTTLGDGLGALVELAPNPDDGLGALVKLAPTVGLLVLVPTHSSA
jgi:hypothetical protein